MGARAENPLKQMRWNPHALLETTFTLSVGLIENAPRSNFAKVVSWKPISSMLLTKRVESLHEVYRT